MNSVSEVYPLRQQITRDLIRYIFLSQGKTEIVKAIEYVYLHQVNGRSLYNLGFGNYDSGTSELLDGPVSNNGDQYKVFNTVLSSVPIFFQVREKAMVMVQGSDSAPEFIQQCRKSCEKNCAPNLCKKAGQRIRIYRGFIDKHFSQLKKSYRFWGRQGFDSQNIIEPWRPGRPYDTLLLTKKLPNFKL